MSARTWGVVAGLVAAIAIAVFFLVRLRAPEPSDAKPTATTVAVTATTSSPPIVPPVTATTSAPSKPIATAPPSLVATASATAKPLDLGSPQSTVDTQLRLLREGRDDEFRATFRPDLTITQRSIDACKQRIEQVPVRPDWEMSQEMVQDGHRVRMVSMFGKGLTGFRETNGRWLADDLWCMPIGLP